MGRTILNASDIMEIFFDQDVVEDNWVEWVLYHKTKNIKHWCHKKENRPVTIEDFKKGIHHEWCNWHLCYENLCTNCGKTLEAAYLLAIKLGV